MSTPDIVELAALVPGERFTRIGAPNVVYVKTSHTWAALNWKGDRRDVPMHWTTLVRRAAPDQRNPGEEV